MKYAGGQALKVLTGDYELGVGSVLDCDDEKEKVQLNIFGLINDLAVDVTAWFDFADVELV